VIKKAIYSFYAIKISGGNLSKSVAILLPPVGLGAVIEYYPHGNVDLKATLIVAAALLVGGLTPLYLTISKARISLAFGILVVCVELYVVLGAFRRLS